MSSETPSLLHGLSVAEKISKLAVFIAEDIDARCVHSLRASGGCYLLIARSPDSPVAQAMRKHVDTLMTAGIRVRAIFSEVENCNGGHLEAPFSMPSECRVIRDQRLLAAHEQLVLSASRAWIGDCMRRDPAKRDAFERFAAGCPQTGAHAMRSFESLWRATAPLFTVPPIAALAQMPEMAGEPALPDGMRRQ